jgi:hypothetical protein
MVFFLGVPLGWQELGLIECRAINLQAACFAGDASYPTAEGVFGDLAGK